MKVICATGTPGTGKTTLSKKLARRMNFYYLDVNKLISKYKLSERYDIKRKTKIVDINKLNKKIIEEIEKKQLIEEILFLLKNFIDKKLDGKTFEKKYMKLWIFIRDEKLRYIYRYLDELWCDADAFVSNKNLLKSLIKNPPVARGEYLNENELRKRTNKIYNKLKSNKIKGIIIDSHLSHYLPRKYVDFCIVAKCDINELNKRLKKKEFHQSKIKENIQAEIFDICLNEAKHKKHRIIAVDTTKDFNIGNIIRMLGD